MAIKVTGYFPNKGNHTFTKDPIIKLEVKQSPMGKLDINCLISIDVEGQMASSMGNTTYSLVVHNFTMNNISRETLLFDELIVDPYDKLLFAVQDYVSESLQSEYPDLTFENYVAPVVEITPTPTATPTPTTSPSSTSSEV